MNQLKQLNDRKLLSGKVALVTGTAIPVTGGADLFVF